MYVLFNGFFWDGRKGRLMIFCYFIIVYKVYLNNLGCVKGGDYVKEKRNNVKINVIFIIWY